MTEIYGRGENWAPNKLVVTNSETKGEYNFLDKGGGGIAYVNKDKNKVLKIIPYNHGSEEIRIHGIMGDLAPVLYFKSSPPGQVLVNEDKTKSFFDGDKVYILIMEYLNPEEWDPINNISQLYQYHSELFDFIYELIFLKGYRNLLDFVGMTGPHLFISGDEEIKTLDFGGYTPVKDKKKDFVLMIKELQENIIILHPTGEDLDCYEKIMNFDTNLEDIDDNCKKYFLYMGREFLEDRLSIERKRKRIRRSPHREGNKILSGKKKRSSKKKINKKNTKRTNKKRFSKKKKSNKSKRK
jgi:hypothetical protein